MEIDKREGQAELNFRRDRVSRWDNYRINHFAYTNNLMLGFNLAFLGFFITQSGLDFNCNDLICVCILGLFTLLLLVGAFVTGVLTVLNRLLDFKKTAILTKNRKKLFEHDNSIRYYTNYKTIKDDISTLKCETRQLGKKTWRLLKIQIWFFLIGTFLGIIFLVVDSNPEILKLLQNN